MSQTQKMEPVRLSQKDLDAQVEHATRLAREAQRALARLEEKTRVVLIKQDDEKRVAHAG